MYRIACDKFVAFPLDHWTSPLAVGPHQLVRSAKIAALVATAWTALCTVLLVGWQTASWLRNGVWNSYSLSAVLKDPESEQVATYTTAAASKPQTEVVGNPTALSWLLDIPSIIPLLIALALLWGFYIWLKEVEKKLSH